MPFVNASLLVYLSRFLTLFPMKPNFLQKTADFIRRKKLLKGEEKVLVACSGGPDSVALLFALKAFSGKLKLKLGVAHLNHQLRPDAAKDADFVQKLAAKLEFPFFYSEVDVQAVSKEHKWSLEEAGRNLRYQFFEQVARDEKFDKIATAHNADDLAETVLMQIIRGSAGPTGIPTSRGNIIRPILWANRQEILEFFRQKKQKYRTDPSNKDLKFVRNRVRSQLLPLLEKSYNPQIRAALTRLADVFAEEKRFLESEAEKLFKKAFVQQENGFGLKISTLKQAPRALQREVLQLILSKNFDFHPEFETIERLAELVEKNGKLELAKNLFAQSTTKNILWFYRKPEKKLAARLKLSDGKAQKVSGLSLSSRKIDRKRLKSLFLPDSWQGYFDAGRLKPPFILRPVENGDRFIPLGMKSPKKVGDFFTDTKVPVFQRRNALVLTSNGKICWVIGYRTADDFKVGPQTKAVLHLKARRNG